MAMNPYEILGVSQGASMDEIKRAYRKKAKECHPDLHPDDASATVRMQQINEAYDMLCNPGRYASGKQAGYGAGAQSYGSQRAYENAWQDAYRSYQQSNPYARYAWYGDFGNAQQTDPKRSRRAPVLNPFLGFMKALGYLFMLRLLARLFGAFLFGFFW